MCINNLIFALLLLASGSFCYGLKHPFNNLALRKALSDSQCFPPSSKTILGATRDENNEVPSLKSRVDRLKQYESEYLLNFWNDELQCFQITMTTKAERVSVVSTCSIVDLILKNRGHWKSHVSWDGSGGTGLSLKAIAASLLDTQWSYDSMQTPTLVKTLSSIRAVDSGNKKFTKAVREILNQRSRLSLHRKQEHSSYLRYINVLALLEMVKHNMIPPDIAETSEVSYALERANLVAYDELSRQLAFHFSGDSSDFDVIILAFSLLAYYETAEAQYFWGAKRKEAAGVQGSANMALVETALKIIFANQFSDGTWRKGEPIYMANSGNSSRDIGNSFVFFFDIVSGIIKTMPQELLYPYLHNFGRCVTWAENNLQKEMPQIDCDMSGLCQGPMIYGWKSNHVSDPATTAWSTSSVFNFLDELSEYLDVAQTSSVLSEFKGKKKETILQETGGRDCWYRLMDADIATGVVDRKVTMKDILFEKVLLPHLIAEVDDQIAMLPPSAAEDAFTLGVELEADTDEDGGEKVMPSSLLREVQQAKLDGISKSPQLYSLILFGPPGTAKTTIATSLAAVINYNFVTIDTATFLANGLENVASRMSYIFDRLKSMTDTVILFDEVEEFCLDRENPNLAMESRMLTTAMLTQLNALRRDQNNIFLIATNRLRSFDAAVIRPGRFDVLLFVGTPNFPSRESRLRSRLMSQSGLNIEDVNKAMELWKMLVMQDWEHVLRFFSYAENEALNSEVITLLRAGTLNENSLKARIDAIDSTSTIQGQVRQEYIDSEGLSRY